MTSIPAEVSLPSSPVSSATPVAVPTPAPARLMADAAVKQRWGTLLACVLSVVTAAAATALVSDYWKGSLKVPISYRGDALLYMPLIRGEMENGSRWTNPRLAAPEGFQAYDFPMPEGLHFFTLRVLAVFSGNWVVAYNLFVLLQFPLAALTATWALRQFGVGVMPAVAAGVLFSYLPHHTLMFHQHIFLTSYYPLPLGVWLAVRLFNGKVTFLARTRSTGRVCHPYLSRVGVGAMAVALLLGFTGAYYAFFMCGLFAAAGIGHALSRGRIGGVMPAAFLAVVVAGGVWVNLAPTLPHSREYGPNPVMKRYVSEGNTYALRPAELLLPSPYHRNEKAAAVTRWYSESFAPTVQPDIVAILPLGAVGAVGLLIGLFALLRRDDPVGDGVQPALSRLLVVALLIAVVGGFGPLFNLLVSPWIRCYHRIGVVVGFLALASWAVALSRLAPSGAKPWRRVAVGGVAVAALGFGLYDQTPREVLTDQDERARQFQSDRAFVQMIERTLPEGAAVFQLPLVEYPEPGYVGEIDNYAPVLGYLHSDKLRWSYGGMKGRAKGDWLKWASGLPDELFVAEVTKCGFDAVWVDRFGYPGRYASIETELAIAADGLPTVSPDGRYAVYSLAGYRQRGGAATADPPAVTLEWGDGFYHEEREDLPARRSLRWAGQQATFTATNHSDRTRRLRFILSPFSHASGSCELRMSGLGEPLSITLRPTPSLVMLELDVPPGSHEVRFTCDGQPGVYSDRTVVFALQNVRFAVVEPDPSAPRR